MHVTVKDGAETLDERECRVVTLPDVRPAAVWRGLAYPLRDEAIAVGEPGVPPSVCREPESAGSRSSYALRGTVGGLYVMLRGSITEAELAAAKLKGAGLSVIRSGRYLGEDIPGFDAEWFLRLTADPTEDVLEKIAATLGACPEWRDERGLRERLLAAELERALARDAEAKDTLSRLKATQEEAASHGEAATMSRAEAEAERQLREAAEAQAWQTRRRVDELEAERAALRSAPENRGDRASGDEFDVALEVLLPRIKLSRDSRDVAIVEYASRKGLYQALAEIDRSTRETPSACLSSPRSSCYRSGSMSLR